MLANRKAADYVRFANGKTGHTASADIAEAVHGGGTVRVLDFAFGKIRTAELHRLNCCGHLHLWVDCIFRVMGIVVALWVCRSAVTVAVVG